MVQSGLRVQEMRSLVPSRVKPMTYKIETCQFLALHSVLLGQGWDWLAQCQYNVTEWVIGSGCQHYYAPMSVYCHKVVIILI